MLICVLMQMLDLYGRLRIFDFDVLELGRNILSELDALGLKLYLAVLLFHVSALERKMLDVFTLSI